MQATFQDKQSSHYHRILVICLFLFFVGIFIKYNIQFNPCMKIIGSLKGLVLPSYPLFGLAFILTIFDLELVLVIFSLLFNLHLQTC